jgi:hypothetical protein
MATLKTKPIGNYIGIWLMFYINITCGLALISQEKMIVKCVGLAASVGIISTFSAIFNAGGRLGFSAWADTMKDRNTIYKLIFILSIAFTVLVMVTQGIKNGEGNTLLIILVIALIMVVNAGAEADAAILVKIKENSNSFEEKSRVLTNGNLELVYELRTGDVPALSRSVSSVEGVTSVSIMSHEGEVSF